MRRNNESVTFRCPQGNPKANFKKEIQKVIIVINNIILEYE